MSTVLVLQHNECEGLGTIADALQGEKIAARHIKTYQGQPVPEEMGEAAGLIIMGGPMGVYEEQRYPFLREEMRLIEDSLRQDRPVLGVCLGSQLLASALGAVVTKGRRKEIGWAPVRLSDTALTDRLWSGLEQSFVAYHWHGDVFDLPPDSVPLASSDLTACQAFRHGRTAYGFLFHMEVTGEIVRNMVAAFADELLEAGLEGAAILQESQLRLPQLRGVGDTVFRRWAALVGQSAQ